MGRNISLQYTCVEVRAMRCCAVLLRPLRRGAKAAALFECLLLRQGRSALKRFSLDTLRKKTGKSVEHFGIKNGIILAFFQCRLPPHALDGWGCIEF